MIRAVAKTTRRAMKLVLDSSTSLFSTEINADAATISSIQQNMERALVANKEAPGASSFGRESKQHLFCHQLLTPIYQWVPSKTQGPELSDTVHMRMDSHKFNANLFVHNTSTLLCKLVMEQPDGALVTMILFISECTEQQYVVQLVEAGAILYTNQTHSQWLSQQDRSTRNLVPTKTQGTEL